MRDCELFVPFLSGNFNTAFGSPRPQCAHLWTQRRYKRQDSSTPSLESAIHAHPLLRQLDNLDDRQCCFVCCSSSLSTRAMVRCSHARQDPSSKIAAKVTKEASTSTTAFHEELLDYYGYRHADCCKRPRDPMDFSIRVCGVYHAHNTRGVRTRMERHKTTTRTEEHIE